MFKNEYIYFYTYMLVCVYVYERSLEDCFLEAKLSKK